MCSSDLILTVLGMAEALVFLGVLIAVAVLLRRMAATMASIESQHIAPAAARVHRILDDVNEVTSTVGSDVRQLRALVRWAMRWKRSCPAWRSLASWRRYSAVMASVTFLLRSAEALRRDRADHRPAAAMITDQRCNCRSGHRE